MSINPFRVRQRVYIKEGRDVPNPRGGSLPTQIIMVVHERVADSVRVRPEGEEKTPSFFDPDGEEAWFQAGNFTPAPTT